MAHLINRSKDFELTFRLHRTKKDDELTWFTVELATKVVDKVEKSKVYTLSSTELNDFKSDLKRMVSGENDKATMVNLDEDLIFNISLHEEILHNCVVEVWCGEPYFVMRGYRFIIEKDSLNIFRKELEEEEKKNGIRLDLP